MNFPAPRKVYGTFRAIVANVDDPDQLDRIKVRIPEILGTQVSAWIWPKHPAVYFSWKPVVNDKVFVEFENGDIDRGVYSGTWYTYDKDNGSTIPEEIKGDDYTRSRIIKTPGGHKVLFKDMNADTETDAPNGITIETFSGHKIDLKDDESAAGIAIETVGGHKLELDDENETIRITHSGGSAKIEIDVDGNVTISSDGDINVTASGKASVTAPQIELGPDGAVLNGVVTGFPNGTWTTDTFTGAPIMGLGSVKAGE